MKAVLALTAVFVCSMQPASALTITTAPVGNLGNSNDPATINLYGAVSYAYNIGTTEVTNAQYVAFLNAVASTDTYGLYDSNMAEDPNIASISRSGASGSYTYSVIGSANHPVTYVNWGDAARFANWLNNGQPTGAQNTATTEGGAYTLNGATSSAALKLVSRNTGATWFIPTENEWYKAAYYQPVAQGGDADSYWAFPTKTNSVPYSDQPPGATPNNTIVGNFYQDDGLANGYDNGYAVTGSTIYSSSQNCLTDVGAYTSSPSYYGTFDQGGSVFEWNEAKIGSSRCLRGGSWNSSSDFLSSSQRFNDPTYESSIGFRVAGISNAVLPGDYNGNGVVDAADYVLWRNGGPLLNDDSPGVQPSDYTLWRSHFGQHTGSAATLGSVPEPSIFMLALAAMTLFACHRRRPTSHDRV